MSVILGSGEYRYRVEEGWGKLPEGWSFHEVGAVGVDRNDNVYVFNRGEHPMIVFDREGNFLRSWGEGMFPRAHGVHMAPDDTIFCTDDGAHCVRKCTLEGKVLMTHRHARQAGAVHERPAILPLHPYRAVAEGRDLRDRRLRQRPGAQIYARWKIPDVVGQVRHRRGRVQPAAQRPLRCRWLGLCGGPREPPRAGVRRQRQVRDGVEQRGASAERAAHDHGHAARCASSARSVRISGRIAASRISGRASASCRPRASCWRGSGPRQTRTARRPASSCRRTASRWTRAATSMWARFRSRPGRRCFPASHGRTICAACRSW